MSELVLQLPVGLAEDLAKLQAEGYGRTLEDVALSLIRGGIIDFYRGERTSAGIAAAMGGASKPLPGEKRRRVGFRTDPTGGR